MTSRRRTTSNQRWNKILYVNVGIYNVEQHRINVVYLNIPLNSVGLRRKNATIFNVDLNNVELNMNIKKLEINFKPRT